MLRNVMYRKASVNYYWRMFEGYSSKGKTGLLAQKRKTAGLWSWWGMVRFQLAAILRGLNLAAKGVRVQQIGVAGWET